MDLTNYILNWYDDLPKDLQEWMSHTLVFYMPEDITKDKIHNYKPVDLFQEFIKKEDFHLFEYIGHILYIKSLIEFFFDNRKTEKDWEAYGNDLLEELDRRQSKDYQKKMLDDLPPDYDESFKKNNNSRIEGIKKYLKNYDKDSTTYITSYEEWQILCKNELSSVSIKKWQDDAFLSASIQKNTK